MTATMITANTLRFGHAAIFPVALEMFRDELAEQDHDMYTAMGLAAVEYYRWEKASRRSVHLDSRLTPNWIYQGHNKVPNPGKQALQMGGKKNGPHLEGVLLADQMRRNRCERVRKN